MIYPWHYGYSSLQARRAEELYRRWGVKVIQPADVEPITLDEAKLHLRVDDDGSSPPSHPDDPLISALITAAREWCEFYSGLSLAPQVIELGGRAFDSASAYRYCGGGGGGLYYGSGAGLYCSHFIELPMPPVSAVMAVTYLDDTGTTQTVSSADYVLDDYVSPPRLYAAAGATWPTAKANTPNAARIRYQAGFDLPNSSPNPNPIPQSAIAAIKLMLSHLYDNRSEVEAGTSTRSLLQQIPIGAQALLDIHRVRLGIA